MAKEDLSSIDEVIRKASEAFAETLSAVNKAVKDFVAQAGAGADREQMVENWIRAARMSKDGFISALDQGFQWWERQLRDRVRRSASSSSAAGGKKEPNPMEEWAESWRKATESFAASGKWAEEARKQAETVQRTLQDGLRAWQRMWSPEKPEKKDG